MSLVIPQPGLWRPPALWTPDSGSPARRWLKRMKQWRASLSMVMAGINTPKCCCSGSGGVTVCNSCLPGKTPDALQVVITDGDSFPSRDDAIAGGIELPDAGAEGRLALCAAGAAPNDFGTPSSPFYVSTGSVNGIFFVQRATPTFFESNIPPDYPDTPLAFRQFCVYGGYFPSTMRFGFVSDPDDPSADFFASADLIVSVSFSLAEEVVVDAIVSASFHFDDPGLFALPLKLFGTSTLFGVDPIDCTQVLTLPQSYALDGSGGSGQAVTSPVDVDVAAPDADGGLAIPPSCGADFIDVTITGPGGTTYSARMFRDSEFGNYAPDFDTNPDDAFIELYRLDAWAMGHAVQMALHIGSDNPDDGCLLFTRQVDVPGYCISDDASLWLPWFSGFSVTSFEPGSLP